MRVITAPEARQMRRFWTRQTRLTFAFQCITISSLLWAVESERPVLVVVDFAIALVQTHLVLVGVEMIQRANWMLDAITAADAAREQAGTR